LDCIRRIRDDKIKYWAILLFFSKAAIIPLNAYSQTWQMSKMHSTIQFSIKYLVITEIRGKFHDYDVALISSKPDFSDAKINITILTNSLDTGNRKRDADLRVATFQLRRKTI